MFWCKWPLQRNQLWAFHNKSLHNRLILTHLSHTALNLTLKKCIQQYIGLNLPPEKGPGWRYCYYLNKVVKLNNNWPLQAVLLLAFLSVTRRGSFSRLQSAIQLTFHKVLNLILKTSSHTQAGLTLAKYWKAFRGNPLIKYIHYHNKEKQVKKCFLQRI